MTAPLTDQHGDGMLPAVPLGERTLVHRHPVYATTGVVLGYALRIHVTPTLEPGEDLVAAVQEVSLTLDLPGLVADRLCFLPATPQMLAGQLPRLDSPSGLVLELSPALVAAPETYEQVVSLYEFGVQLLIADYTGSDAQDHLLPFATFVSLLPGLPTERLASAVTRAHAAGKVAIAFGVDDEISEEVCRLAGVDAVCTTRGGLNHAWAEPPRREPAPTKVLRAGQMQCLAVLDLLPRDEPDIEGVIQIIETDPVLTLRMLHLVNSGAFGVRHEVDTVGHAVLLLGPQETMALVVGLLVDARPDVMDSLWFILARAQACESLAGDPAAYTVGMLSSLSVQLGVPDEVLLEAVATTPAVEDAIRSETGPYGPVLAAVRGHEAGNHQKILDAGMQPATVSAAYVAAVTHALATAQAVTPRTTPS